MNNLPSPNQTEDLAAMFEQLSQLDVEEFYLSYQYWHMQDQIETVQNRLNQIRRMMLENSERIQQVQPTAIELATLVRLQSNGVFDVDLLDRMLERGEVWLDRTMQHLDYLEQLDDFIRADYTQWCHNALEGAYDWIDSVLGGESSSSSQETLQVTSDEVTEDVKQEKLIEVTEELFLQKISAEDELQADEITSKRPSIVAPDAEEIVPSPEDAIPANHMEETQVETVTSEGLPSLESGQTPPQEPSSVQKPIETEAVAQTPSRPSTYVAQVDASTKRPGPVKRFLGKIWGS